MSTTREEFIASLKKEKIKKNILDIMADVPREHFLDPLFKKDAYRPEPMPIGAGQAMDDPVALARMLDALAPKKNWHVLEVGTGSGYSTCLLSRMVQSVATVDYHEELAAAAKGSLAELGVNNVRFFAGDATTDDRQMEEFDALIIFAACVKTPIPLLTRLKSGGTMVFPLGPAHQQQITRYTNDFSAENILDCYKFMQFCVFPSIRGRYGWEDIPSPVVIAGENDGIAGRGPGR